MLKSQFLRRVFPYSIFGKSTQNNQVGGFGENYVNSVFKWFTFFLFRPIVDKNSYSQVISQNTSSKPDS